MVDLLAFYANATHASDGLLHPWDTSQVKNNLLTPPLKPIKTYN
jgi:hypothetical protein